MKIIEKYLVSDAQEKICFHCKQKPAAKGMNTCPGCRKELDAWKNKKNKLPERV